MDGFLPDSVLAAIKTPLPLVPRCGSCGLHKQCADEDHLGTPKMPVDGKGALKALIIGEAPGRTENKYGRQFIGKAGKYLKATTDALGVDLREDCWLTNALICWPWKKDQHGNKANRTPTEKEISWCRPNLIRVIEELGPELIIPLGGPAVHSLMGWLWKSDVGLISRWTGWYIPSQRLNAWICPANHPSYCMRQQSDLVDRIFQQQLAKAFDHKGRPWPQLPRYADRVQVLLAPRQAAYMVDEITRMGRPVAFDYEDEALKPDSKDVNIVSCSLSNGVVTIAYPWVGEAIDATKRLLLSPLPKIAQNMKHEHRWSLAKLGLRVRNWAFDPMVAAHVLDNRQGICSLKFQAFVRLGQEPYDEHIKPFLEGKNNQPNRVRKIDTRQLLLYNALDSLLAWELAQLQAKELGVSLTGIGVDNASPNTSGKAEDIHFR